MASIRPKRNCARSEEHTSELQSRQYLVCRLLLEKKKKIYSTRKHTGVHARADVRRLVQVAGAEQSCACTRLCVFPLAFLRPFFFFFFFFSGPPPPKSPLFPPPPPFPS